MKIFVWSVTAALLLAVAAPMSSATDNPQRSVDETPSAEFIRDAIRGNLAEVKLGQLAQRKGQSDAVRSLGDTLVKDHLQANREAIQVAYKINVVPPSEPNLLQKATYDRLAQLSGAQFDQEFVMEAVDAHQRTIQMYEKAQKRDDAAAAYAESTLPALRRHLEIAKVLVSKQVPSV